MGAFTVLAFVQAYKVAYNNYLMGRQSIKRYLFFSIASFLAVLLIMLLTSPIKNITYATAFFAAFFVLLLSIGHLLTYLRRRQVTPKSRSWIVIVSAFIVLIIMFRSAQSLNWVDALILLLVVAGLLFYTSRR